jgi:hypothetical protein
MFCSNFIRSFVRILSEVLFEFYPMFLRICPKFCSNFFRRFVRILSDVLFEFCPTLCSNFFRTFVLISPSFCSKFLWSFVQILSEVLSSRFGHSFVRSKDADGREKCEESVKKFCPNLGKDCIKILALNVFFSMPYIPREEICSTGHLYGRYWQDPTTQRNTDITSEQGDQIRCF